MKNCHTSKLTVSFSVYKRIAEKHPTSHLCIQLRNVSIVRSYISHSCNRTRSFALSNHLQKVRERGSVLLLRYIFNHFGQGLRVHVFMYAISSWYTVVGNGFGFRFWSNLFIQRFLLQDKGCIPGLVNLRFVSLG